MRIAIVGAGLSGLACAHELERLGYAPEVFERSRYVGDRLSVPETMAQCLHFHPRQDIWRYLREDLMLPVQPAHAVTRMVIHSPSQVATLQGQLGYVAIRGRDDRSVERQLERHISARIHFGAAPDLDELRREYDRVVVATGDHGLTRRLGRWQPGICWQMRGALVRGEFQPGELHFFLLTRYAHTGFATLSALDERTAVARVAVPGGGASDADRYWSIFRSEQEHRWDREIEQFRMAVDCGQSGAPVVGNVLLTGVAGGFVEPLGMNGPCPALTSGVLAARQIALDDRSLTRFARRWRVYYDRLDRIRRSVNGWTDDDMDRLGLALRAGVTPQSPVSFLESGGLLLDALRMADE